MMPYTNVRSLPGYVKKQPAVKQRQWLHIFNSVYAKVLRETDSDSKAETAAFKAANSFL
jgi:cation transport regulator ChaB